MTPPPIPEDNPLTHAGVALGRYLFYDTRLSGNNSQSCASCHQQPLSFTDGRTVSVGSEGGFGQRMQWLERTAPYFGMVKFNLG